MNIQLIQGTFSSKDAIDLVTQMIHIKIRYHENKILNNSSEEEIKYRETKIKNLQKELFELRKYVDENVHKLNIDAEIKIEK
jgi:uncharacterized lipoprotein YehR (DUF1307 family)